MNYFNFLESLTFAKDQFKKGKIFDSKPTNYVVFNPGNPRSKPVLHIQFDDDNEVSSFCSHENAIGK